MSFLHTLRIEKDGTPSTPWPFDCLVLSFFGVDADDKSIITIDSAEIALAAIKALYQRNNNLEQNNKALSDRLSKLEEMIEKLSEK